MGKPIEVRIVPQGERVVVDKNSFSQEINYHGRNYIVVSLRYNSPSHTEMPREFATYNEMYERVGRAMEEALALTERYRTHEIHFTLLGRNREIQIRPIKKKRAR